MNGIDPFLAYVRVSADLMKIPYVEGFPAFLLLTPYGLLTTTLPQSAWPLITQATTGLALIAALALAAYAVRLRRRPAEDRAPAIVLACFFPLLAAPYALLHDLVIVVPAFLLWSRFAPPPRLRAIAAAPYLAAFFVTLVAMRTKVAWMALATLALVAEQIRSIAARRERPTPTA